MKRTTIVAANSKNCHQSKVTTTPQHLMKRNQIWLWKVTNLLKRAIISCRMTKTQTKVKYLWTVIRMSLTLVRTQWAPLTMTLDSRLRLNINLSVDFQMLWALRNRNFQSKDPMGANQMWRWLSTRKREAEETITNSLVIGGPKMMFLSKWKLTVSYNVYAYFDSITKSAVNFGKDF